VPRAAIGGMTSNVAGALAYILGFITGVIFLVLEPYNRDKFVRFHAFQSVFFSAAMIAFQIVWGIFMGVFGFGFLWRLFYFVDRLVMLAAFLVWLYTMYKAYNNEKYMLPTIGELALKQAEK